MDLRAMLPTLMPLAVQWAQAQERLILQQGVALSKSLRSDAEATGVRFPDRIRTLTVVQVPAPQHPALRTAALQTRLISGNTAGMALGYGIFLRKDVAVNREIVVHECVHVAQYEKLGSIQQFLEVYLRQILSYGYEAAPLEREAVSVARRVVMALKPW